MSILGNGNPPWLRVIAHAGPPRGLPAGTLLTQGGHLPHTNGHNDQVDVTAPSAGTRFVIAFLRCHRPARLRTSPGPCPNIRSHQGRALVPAGHIALRTTRVSPGMNTRFPRSQVRSGASAIWC